jgi:hypothetical protein
MIRELNSSIVLLVACGLVQSPDELANTKWECRIGKECTDELRFKAGHKVVAYSCELDEESPGNYQLNRDTLIINSIKDGEEMKERWRYKYLLREGRLRPISTEEFIHRKWQMVRSVFEPDYIFLKGANADKEIFAMLRSFYTKYIQTFNQYPTDEEKLRPLLKANCDPQLLARLKKKTENGDLDSDPFLKAQDVDLRWLKTLVVTKVPDKADQYAVSYVDNADRSTVVIHLVVNRLNGSLKIRDVLLDR